jgi:hypothetical protein
MEENKKRPQDKWNEKNGYISKSYRMRKELADEFKEVCEAVGVSQSGQIVKMMADFIKKNKEG